MENYGVTRRGGGGCRMFSLDIKTIVFVFFSSKIIPP